MPNLAEALLARLTDRTRAAAIMGDLAELAATRGRLWFAAAYARTLLSLIWRVILALVIATIGRQIIVNSFHTYTTHTPDVWRTTGAPFLLNHMGPPLAILMVTLWFVLPFAAVVYGVRDRFVQLTFAVALGTLGALLYIPFVSLTCAIATIALAVAALLSPEWRKPLEVLLWTGAAGFLLIAAVNAADTAILNAHPDLWASHFFRHYGMMIIFRSSLLVLAIVCARMHTLLLHQPRAAA